MQRRSRERAPQRSQVQVRSIHPPLRSSVSVPDPRLPHAQNYWMNNHIDTGYPQVNVGFDQW